MNCITKHAGTDRYVDFSVSKGCGQAPSFAPNAFLHATPELFTKIVGLTGFSIARDRPASPYPVRPIFKRLLFLSETHPDYLRCLSLNVAFDLISYEFPLWTHNSCTIEYYIQQI
jgi:hypothetical protein